MTGLVLAAAGSGSRFGSAVPKQFASYQGVPLYLRALERFVPFCSELVLVVPAAWMKPIAEQIRPLPYGSRTLIEAGGDQRQDSVTTGVNRLSDSVEIVLVHDAARPFVSARLISAVIEGARRYGACVPVLPVSDTVKEVEGDRVVQTLDRSRLRLAQTPQGFQSAVLHQALQEAARQRFLGTDEAVLVERLGLTVHAVAGERGNRKITWKEDFDED